MHRKADARRRGSGGRQFYGIVGASSTVITAEDIAHSPSQTLPEIIAQVPGVQLPALYGGVNGAKTSVDLRGFGAFATNNTLFLLNGRRLNDVDMAGFDLRPSRSIRSSVSKSPAATAARCSMATTRSAALSTSSPKNGVGGPPVTMKAEAGVRLLQPAPGHVSAATNYGPWSTSFYGNGIKSDGYRVNNALDQRNGVGNLNYTTPDLTAFLTVTGNDQKLGFPAAGWSIPRSD